MYTKEILDDVHSKMLEKFNITTPQLEIIKILYFSKDSSISQDQIGHYTFSSKANISSHLTKLENKKFITREEDKTNKRRKTVKLTKQGEQKLFDIVDECNPKEFPSLLNKQESKEFLKLLEKIRINTQKVINK